MCWNHEIFTFQSLKKVRYIRRYVSASQYKAGENTNMYARIVASWLQLIYFLWVFYVRILSICHNFIESSISGGLVPHDFSYCLQVNNHKRVGPRVTKAHWFNPCQFIISVWKAIISRESVIGTLCTIELTHGNFFTGYKTIISRESDQGALSPVGLIPSIFLTGFN